MIYPGLVSVTFRQLEPMEIVRLVKKAGLSGIEWGGDIHVPHGNIRRAAETFKMTEGEGLQIAAYGSYYRVGCQTNKEPFEAVLETAEALHAPTIRVWAGDKSSNKSDKAYWNTVITDTRRIAELAAGAGITVSFEYHPNTLTDTPESACRLMKVINHPNAKSYWQSSAAEDMESWMAGLLNIIPWLTNVHVSGIANNEYVDLSQRRDVWSAYFNVLKKLKDNRFCMLEFVKDKNPNQFLRDAVVLKSLIL